MTKHAKYLIYLVETQIFLSLLYLSNYRERNTRPFGKFFLGKIYFLPFSLYEICKLHHDHLLLQRILTNITIYMQIHIKTISFQYYMLLHIKIQLKEGFPHRYPPWTGRDR